MLKSTVVQDNRGWHRVNRQEELLTGEGGEEGDGRAEGSSATGDRRQAAISHLQLRAQGLVPCWSILSAFLKNNPIMSEWELFFSHHRCHGSTELHSEWPLQPSCTILHSGPVPQNLTVPPQTELTYVTGGENTRLRL